MSLKERMGPHPLLVKEIGIAVRHAFCINAEGGDRRSLKMLTSYRSSLGNEGILFILYFLMFIIMRFRSHVNGSSVLWIEVRRS